MQEDTTQKEESHTTKDDLAKSFLELYDELFETINANDLNDEELTLKNEHYEIKLKRLK